MATLAEDKKFLADREPTGTEATLAEDRKFTADRELADTEATLAKDKQSLADRQPADTGDAGRGKEVPHRPLAGGHGRDAG